MRAFKHSYENTNDAHFAARFRACAERSGKTQKEIGDAIGLSSGQVGRICRGGGCHGF
jgi:hypothetical protein